MIHTNLPRKCVVFLLLCELTRRPFESKIWLPLMADRVSRRGKRKTTQFRVILVWIIILILLKFLYNHIYAYFKTNGYKRFSKTNSTDPRQRVPLNHTDSSVFQPRHPSKYFRVKVDPLLRHMTWKFVSKWPSRHGSRFRRICVQITFFKTTSGSAWPSNYSGHLEREIQVNSVKGGSILKWHCQKSWNL